MRGLGTNQNPTKRINKKDKQNKWSLENLQILLLSNTWTQEETLYLLEFLVSKVGILFVDSEGSLSVPNVS